MSCEIDSYDIIFLKQQSLHQFQNFKQIIQSGIYINSLINRVAIFSTKSKAILYIEHGSNTGVVHQSAKSNSSNHLYAVHY